MAAAWALGIPTETIRAAPRDSPSDMQLPPGTLQSVRNSRGATVVIDDSHNSSALAALIAALDNFPHDRRTIVYSAGDGRRDADIVRQGEQLGVAFDRVILYEDYSASIEKPENWRRSSGRGWPGRTRTQKCLMFPITGRRLKRR